MGAFFIFRGADVFFRFLSLFPHSVSSSRRTPPSYPEEGSRDPPKFCRPAFSLPPRAPFSRRGCLISPRPLLPSSFGGTPPLELLGFFRVWPHRRLIPSFFFWDFPPLEFFSRLLASQPPLRGGVSCFFGFRRISCGGQMQPFWLTPVRPHHGFPFPPPYMAVRYGPVSQAPVLAPDYGFFSCCRTV